MRFSTEIKDVELPGLVNEFVQIAGATTLQKGSMEIQVRFREIQRDSGT
jgi:hypothetical protein